MKRRGTRPPVVLLTHSNDESNMQQDPTMPHATAVLFVILSLLWPGAPLAAEGQTDQPNVIFILADDWGYGDVKCLGGDTCKIETPNMDRLANEGMIFTDAHSSSAVCTPTRYSVLTGRYNWRSSLKSSVLRGYSPRLIEAEQSTVAELLRNHGYQTACIGKWHLGMGMPTTDGAEPSQGKLTLEDVGTPLPPGMTNVDWHGVISDGPTALGFSYYYGISASLDMPPYIWIENDRFVGACTTIKAFHRPGPAHADFEDHDVLPVITRKSVEFIHANKDQPLFMYIPLNSPHTPISPSKDWVGKSSIGPYGDFVMETDWSVGQIVQAVDEAGLSERTLIIVTADNGCSPAARKPNPEPLVFNGAATEPIQADKHYPSKHYRGHKADIYDGGHRVPFIARWTGTVPAGSSCDETVCLVDLFATCAELIGSTLSENDAPDSISMLPLLLGETPEQHREATVHHSINGSFAIRRGMWKLVLCPGSGGWSDPRPPRRNQQITAADIDQWVQLYNLEQDPAETANLAEQHPELVAELTDLLQNYVDRGRSTPGEALQNTGETHIYPKWIRTLREP